MLSIQPLWKMIGRFRKPVHASPLAVHTAALYTPHPCIHGTCCMPQPYTQQLSAHLTPTHGTPLNASSLSILHPSACLTRVHVASLCLPYHCAQSTPLHASPPHSSYLCTKCLCMPHPLHTQHPSANLTSACAYGTPCILTPAFMAPCFISFFLPYSISHPYTQHHFTHLTLHMVPLCRPQSSVYLTPLQNSPLCMQHPSACLTAAYTAPLGLPHVIPAYIVSHPCAHLAPLHTSPLNTPHPCTCASPL